MPTDAPRQKNKIKFLILIIALLLVWQLGRALHIDAVSIRDNLSSLPVFWAGAAFIALYVILTFFIWFSKDLLRIIAAVVFGACYSTLFILIAEMINAFILFHMARALGRGFVEKDLRQKGRWLDEKLTRSGFLWLFLFRATPLLPFRFLDLAAGLTGMPFRKYLLAVALGSPLRIFWVQYVLAGAGEMALGDPYALSAYISGNKPLFLFSLVYVALVVVVASKLKAKS